MTDRAAIDLEQIVIRRHPTCHTNSIVLDDDFNSLVAAIEALRERAAELASALTWMLADPNSSTNIERAGSVLAAESKS